MDYCAPLIKYFCETYQPSMDVINCYCNHHLVFFGATLFPLLEINELTKILSTCKLCNCCERHQKNKLITNLPVKQYNFAQKMENYSCRCHCRTLCRELIRYIEKNFAKNKKYRFFREEKDENNDNDDSDTDSGDVEIYNISCPCL